MNKFNLFEIVCFEAAKNRWCWKLSCTTCGQSDFRNALSELSPDDFKSCNLSNLSEHCPFPDWLGYLGVAIDHACREQLDFSDTFQQWAQQLWQVVEKGTDISDILSSAASGKRPIRIKDLELVEKNYKITS